MLILKQYSFSHLNQHIIKAVVDTHLFKNITEYSLCTKIISRNIQPDVNNEYLNTRMEKKELIENLGGKINISICYNSYPACYKNNTNIIELRFTLICQREQKAMRRAFKMQEFKAASLYPPLNDTFHNVTLFKKMSLI